ncbi:lipopolysaccharide biosynthesis protein [Rudaeicoccus suwonensis]|uniref:O-antigen/teichoic acid export membrane protein n=1 Tax=Rudaeicoccus suwonensis TaxID=657409 RepID=A0A561E8S3_9MICO|nr:oligosaccharide flippase family protein [Rudaeicoccus suwonensis]TWE12015.1 O-antigen/teichoic acid export membrane protein [Rudaeicoccus suwonensis]
MSGTSWRRASLTVLIGSVAGFGINLLLTPVLSRVYSPAVFGTYSTILAVGSSIVGISTFRLEVRAQGEADGHRAAGMLHLAFLSSLGWSIVATVVGAVAVSFGAPLGWALVGVIVFTGSLQLVGTAIWVRRQHYRSLGGANFIQGAGTGIAQVAIGLWRPIVGVLVVGFAVPRLVWSQPYRDLVRDTGGARGLSSAWRYNRAYAMVAGTSAGVNSLAGQGFVVLVAAMYGSVGAALVAMAMRILVSPLTIIGQAAASAAVGEIGSAMRKGESGRYLLGRGVRDLGFFGAVPCAVAAIAAPYLAPLVLGRRWTEVGIITSWMALGAFPQFVVAPFSQLMNMSGRSNLMLRWDISRLIAVALTITVPHVLGAGVVTAVAAFSISQVLLYAGLLLMVRRAVEVGAQIAREPRHLAEL